MSNLGRFLEISVQTTDILESLSFYKSLGFREAQINDIWPHKYAVVTDGLLSIGLHEREFRSPAITFVLKDIAKRARSMTDHGTEFNVIRLDEDVFNEIGLLDNDGHQVSMVEARTFNLDEEDDDDSACGTLFEISLPVKDAVRAALFWGPMAQVLEEHREEPTVHMRFDAGGIPVGLSESIGLEQASLCFRDPDTDKLPGLIERFGLDHKKFPGYEGARCVLTAPEGTRLYVFDNDFLGEAIKVEESEDTSSFPSIAIPDHHK